MNTYQINTMQCFTAVVGLALLSMQPMSVVAGDRDESAYKDDHHLRGGDHHRRIKRIRGVPVTGVNSVLGKPFFSWGEPFGAAFNYPAMGVFNKDGADPLPLDANTPQSAILSTYIDPVFLALLGKPADYVVNPEWINVPLRDVPINIDFAFVQKQTLPGVREAGALELAQAQPANDITLGQWMEASGVVTINCSGAGADVKLRMRSLIPNRMYSVWALMGLPPQPGSTIPAAFPIPIGGTPNFFMTDKNGAATFSRWMKGCPLDTQSMGSPMLLIDVHYNANQQTYGAVVTPGFIDGNWPGIITFSHVVFPINVELLDN